MLIGIIGAPNKGKSTIFSAMTMASAEIADYPFTTIKPNFGIAYATRRCIETELRVKCMPRNSLCKKGTRYLPINMTDVAGLVPGAHLGKGMGNQFLNDLVQAEALIQVVDLSGRTDTLGNGCDYSNPAEEVAMVRNELADWLSGIISKHIKSISKRNDGDVALKELLSGFNVNLAQIQKAAEANYLTTSNIGWNDEDLHKFADALMRLSKPTIIAANKLDKSGGDALQKLRMELKDYKVVGCSGAVELALRQADKSGAIEYVQGSEDFEVKKEVSTEQRSALNYMSSYLKKNRGTGVQDLANAAVFELLENIVAYPVEDENKYTDHDGNVLPDALLLRNGSTAAELASRIHTDLAKGMLYGIDAKRKVRIGKDYVLKNDDVIRIVSSR